MKDEDLWKHLLKYKGISSVLDDQFDDSITSGTKEIFKHFEKCPYVKGYELVDFQFISYVREQILLTRDYIEVAKMFWKYGNDRHLLYFTQDISFDRDDGYMTAWRPK